MSETFDACGHQGCTRLYAHRHCVVCGRAFVSAGSTGEEICGQVHCRARHLWGPADWAGRARMARARLAAGLDLDDLDREAIARTQTSH